MKKNKNERIIDFLEEHGPSTSAAIAKGLMLSQADTTSRLASMRKQKERCKEGKYAVLNCDTDQYPFIYSIDKTSPFPIEREDEFGRRI